MKQNVHRVCTLCEATCGLTFEVEDNHILSVRPDPDDVFSHGYACPKGIAIAEIHDDPDRLRQPMRRRTDGEFEPISWKEAFDETERRLLEVRRQHGNDAVGLYWGNPLGNNHRALLVLEALKKAADTPNCFSAGSQDANPRLMTSLWLYGSTTSMPIPDIDRSDYFLCIGANPVISNGSVMTAPDARGRLRALRKRGGKLVVVDPRRTETARDADEWVSIRPGTDAAMLLSMAHVLVQHRRVAERTVASQCNGWEVIQELLPAFEPARVAPYCGVDADTIQRLALELAAAPSSVVYSRYGVCTAEHATLATYATDLLNILAGRLGSEGGAMFPSPAFDMTDLARQSELEGFGRWHSRVRGLPEAAGDLPSAVMAEEMETEGPGQIRGMLTVAGNPVLSAPNGSRIDKALGGLDFMVSVDLYINETTRHADIILPPCWTLAEDHIDLLFSQVMVRNIARYSPAVVDREEGEKADWEIMVELAERLGGGQTGNRWIDTLLRGLRKVGITLNPTTVSSLLLRMGPYGDRFLPWSSGLNMSKLRAAPHGIDLGPMKPGYAHRVYHKDGRVDLAPQTIVDAIRSLDTALDAPSPADELLLIGRREMRSMNSWMHNAPSLVSGRERCVLYVHPDDAGKRGILDGQSIVMESRVFRGPVTVQLSDEMRCGVVSLPHGWGHAAVQQWQSVATLRPGVSANDWTDDGVVESVLGQSILNGVPVQLHAET